MGLIFNGNGDVIKAVDGSLTVEGLDLGGSSNVNAGIGTFSSLSVTGTLTYEDVKNVDSVGIVTARAGLHAKDDSTFYGVTSGRNVVWDKSENSLEFGDYTYAKFGLDEDLTVWSNNTASAINNKTGELRILSGTNVRILKRSDAGLGFAAQVANFNIDGACDFYHNGTKRIETTNTGATVTGTLTATTLTGALSTTDACQTGDLTILNGNPDLRLKDSNHGGNNTEHIIAFQDSSGNNQMNIGSPFGEQHLRIKHGTTDLVKIQTDGKVGINEASPDTPLHITGGLPHIRLENSGTSASAGDVFGQIDFKHNDSDDAGITAAIKCIAEDNAGNSYLTFHNGDGGNADERLRIASDGDIGIGTATIPGDTKVHLYDSSTSNYRSIVIDSAATNGSTLVYRQLGTQVISIGSGGGNNLSGSSVTHGLIRSEVATVFAVGNSEKLRIASDGEVFIGEGFGATNRSTLLSVSGAHQDPAGVWAQVGLYSSDSQAASKGGSISFGGQDGTTSKSVFAAILGAKENSTSGNYAGYMAFYTRPAGAVSKERLRISSTGAALMGTTSNPNLSGSYSAGTIVIDVNHTSNANAIIVSDMTQNNACLLTQPFTNHTYYAGYWTSWDGTNEGEIAVSTKNGGTQYQTSSDYRRKENLVNITDGITQVKALKPYRFNMIGTPDVIRQGFLAHEVQEILPEAVSGVKDGIAAEDDGLHKKGEPIYQGLDYGRLTPILTAALKELIAEVDTLKTKVAALEG